MLVKLAAIFFSMILSCYKNTPEDPPPAYFRCLQKVHGKFF